MYVRNMYHNKLFCMVLTKLCLLEKINKPNSSLSRSNEYVVQNFKSCLTQFPLVWMRAHRPSERVWAATGMFQ